MHLTILLEDCLNIKTLLKKFPKKDTIQKIQRDDFTLKLDDVRSYVRAMVYFEWENKEIMSKITHALYIDIFTLFHKAISIMV